MIAGVCWARWVVGIATAAPLLALRAAWPQALTTLVGWLLITAYGVTPSLLAAQRVRHQRRIKRLQGREAMKMSRLQERARSLLQLQGVAQRLESQIGQITDLYHVTRETAKALHVEQLFAASLELVPSLVQLEGLRLIDQAVGSQEQNMVWRARKDSEGRLRAEAAQPMLAVERRIAERASQTGLSGILDAAEVSEGWPPGVQRLAWAPVWAEQEPVGALIADDLAPEQLGTLSIVANQLSLQLSRIHLYQSVEAMAVTDTLTGLSVRRYFLELASDELQRAKRHRLPGTFLMVDLDHFKQKNDTYGHLVGDVILRDVAQLMKRHLRGVDLIARYGGEEFILLLIETGPEAAMAIAERLRQLVEVHPIRAYDETLSQTISIGVASFPDDGQELQQLIDRADEALYRAKRTGRNRVVQWSKREALEMRASSPGSQVSRLS